jgi:hypothetical protein
MYKVKISFEFVSEDYQDVANTLKGDVVSTLKGLIDLCAYRVGQVTIQSIQVEYQGEYLPDKQLVKEESNSEELRDHD